MDISLFAASLQQELKGNVTQRGDRVLEGLL